MENGDHLDQKTFHARYEAMPEGTRAELIGGIVYMSSPLKRPHGRMHKRASHWLTEYEDATPGTEGFDNATNILGEENEPQPDLCLLIAPDKGGQTREENEYIFGGAELILEIASSTESIDLHRKRRDYEEAGVREYVVVVIRQARVFWFVSRNGRFEDLPLGTDGIFRSEVFPGLWLDPAALLRRDAARLREVLQQGLASPEHTAFVARLAAR
ncbi:MAG TPA: Uma2 family endonuclease [Gemmataceae bacterium]|nr:Uma2 family endonuclease [Gemmataceae bacterium]